MITITIVVIAPPCHMIIISFFVVGIIKISSLGKFDVYNTILLSIFTILHIRSLGLIYYLLQVCALNNISIPYSLPSLWEPQF